MVPFEDIEIITQQLGRAPRGILEVVYRTREGVPVVIKTAPILEDGTPFPTLYYLTEPKLVALVSQLESTGLMRKMSAELQSNSELASKYRLAHQSYLKDRNQLTNLHTEFTGGGMPDRVKCLHFLVAHSLAVGAGVNPIGDETIALLLANGLGKDIFPVGWPANEYVWG